MKTFAYLVFCLFCGAASASEKLEVWGLPDPSELMKASQTLCADQAKTALLAWHFARSGRTREEVLALVPESPKAFTLRVTTAMRENVEDAFSYPGISQYTLYSFRSEVCMRETLGAVRMPRLATVRSEIEQCQKSHGTEKNNELFKCIQAVVRKVEPQ